MIAVTTLGPVAVAVDGATAPAELLWRKHLALLVYLARSPQRGRSREHLVGLLWADRPAPAARHSLREAVHVLRRTLGEGGVEASGEQVRLRDGAVDLDVDRLAAEAGRGDWAAAAARLHGEFLEGFTLEGAPEFEDWLSAERAEWRRRGVEVLAARARELARAGRSADGAAAARRALACDPLSETAAAAAMETLALAGDRAAALEVYAAFAARAERELGVAPGGPLRSLAERVRAERAWRLPRSEAAPRGAESRRTPLIGRGQTLGALLGAWDGCRATRRAALLFVEGDPGTGRTRLAEEVVARARLDGAAWSAVRAVPADRDEPWSGTLGLARGGLLDAAGVAAAPPAALAAFASRLSEWGDRFPATRRVPPAPLGPALADVLRAAADEQPVLLVLDDAHWCDPDSLQALEAALRDGAAAPLAALVTTTPGPGREALDRLCARVGRDVPGAAVHLAALDRDALRALAAWAMPAYSDEQCDRLARRIEADSAGLPLLAVELLHAVALGLELADGGTPWPAEHRTLDQSLPGDLPDGVTAAIRVGFQRVSRDAQTVLAAASVLGDRVPRHALARATGLGADALDAALDELEWQRWLAAEPRGYSFAARMVRDVVARDMLTGGQRQRILEAAGLRAAPPR